MLKKITSAKLVLAGSCRSISRLLITFSFAFMVSGKEPIENPILVLLVFLVWIGTLVGVTVGNSTDW